MAKKTGDGCFGTVTDSSGNAFTLLRGTQKVNKNGSDSSFPSVPTELFIADINGDEVFSKTVSGIWYKYNGSSWVKASRNPRDM